MSIEQKTRFLTLLKKFLIVIALGIGYFLFIKLVGWGIPCPIHLLTGKLCPGCGISRMFVALIQLDLVTAARYNLLILCLLPFGLLLLIYKSVVYIRTGKNLMPNWEKAFYLVAFILAIVFTVLRNMDVIPFLKLP